MDCFRLKRKRSSGRRRKRAGKEHKTGSIKLDERSPRPPSRAMPMSHTILLEGRRPLTGAMRCYLRSLCGSGAEFHAAVLRGEPGKTSSNLHPQEPPWASRVLGSRTQQLMGQTGCSWGETDREQEAENAPCQGGPPPEGMASPSRTLKISLNKHCNEKPQGPEIT